MARIQAINQRMGKVCGLLYPFNPLKSQQLEEMIKERERELQVIQAYRDKYTFV